MPITLVRYWGREVRSAREMETFAELFTRSVNLGWRTHLVCSQPPQDENHLAPLTDIGVQVEYIGRPRQNFDRETIRRTYELCSRVKPDILHCDNIHTSPLIGAFLARVPVRIWFKRSMQPAFEDVRVPTWRDRLAPSVRVSCRLATTVATVSRAVKDELVAMGIPEAKICVVRNAIDRGAIQWVDRDHARAELGYTNSDVVVMALGRAAPVKGWDVLLSAFIEIVAEFPNARLLFVGGTFRDDEKQMFSKLAEVVASRGLTQYVRFAGHRENVDSALAAADIFVMPSRSEGNANALNEAFAAGKACIATRVGNAPELITQGVNGLLVERDNPCEMAEALGSLIGDGALRARIERGARETPVGPTRAENFDQIYALYQALLRARRGERDDWRRLYAQLSRGREL